jgi:hypothetical protein
VWGKMPAYRQCRQDLDSIPSAAQRLIEPPIHFSVYLPMLKICITKRLCYGRKNVPLLRDVILATVMQARESFAGNQVITHPNSWKFSAYLSMHTVTSPQISL